jgi:radical SAM protein with 4Fe4S-binding SPASM domain
MSFLCNSNFKEITIEINQRCLNQCLFCSSNSHPNASYSMPFDTIQEILNDIVQFSINEVSISGGEPFLHDDLHRILNLLQNKGLKTRLYTSGITEKNGAKSSIEKCDLEIIKNHKNILIIFNLPHTDRDIFDYLTGDNGNYNIAIQSLKNCIESGFRVEVHTVPLKQNICDVESFIKSLADLGVKQVSFLRFVPQGRGREHEETLTPTIEELKDFSNEILRIKQTLKDVEIRMGIPFTNFGFQNKKCNAGESKLIIRYDGLVFPCEAYKGNCRNDSVFGSVYKKSISDILLGKERESFIHSKNNSLNMEACPAQLLYVKELVS